MIKRTWIATALILSAAPPAMAETAVVVPAVPAPIPDEALKLGREIVANGFPPESRRKMFEDVMVSLMAQMRSAQASRIDDPGAEAILSRNLATFSQRALAVADKHSTDMFDAIARAYARAFPLDELRQIRDFSATSAGKHFISRGSSLMADPDVAASNKAYFAEVMALMPAFQERLKAELIEYFAAKSKQPKPS